VGTLASQARISIKGFRPDPSIDEHSPLEAQVELVYQAAAQYAKANKFNPYRHDEHDGRAGQLVMSQIVGSLFPRVTGDEFKTLRSIIYQVLRRTDMAVCLAHGEGVTTPVWFVNNKPSRNLTIAIANMRGKAPGNTILPLTQAEKKLTPTEAGEDREPSPVTTRQKENNDVPPKNPAQHLKDHHAMLAEKHRLLLLRMIEEIATNPQPLTVPDLHKLLGKELETVSVTTFQHAAGELVSLGQLVHRKETEAEALIRGGGRKPKAQRPRLYGIAPGPVPPRTALPTGITATSHVAGAASDTAEIRDRIVQSFVEHRGRATVPQVLERTGLEMDRRTMKSYLNKLVADGRLESSQHRYFIRRNRSATRPITVTDDHSELRDTVVRTLARRGMTTTEAANAVYGNSPTPDQRSLVLGMMHRLDREGSITRRNGRYYIAEGTELPPPVTPEPETPTTSDAPDDKFAQLAEYAKTLFDFDGGELLAENTRLQARVVELEEKVRKQAAAIAALS